MIGTIYKIQNIINNKIYIGLTSRKVEQRWEEHRKAALSDCPRFENIHLYRGMRKYGIDNFCFSIVETNIKSLEELNNKEIYWIEFYDSYQNGYNMNMGGNSHYQYDHEKIQEMWLKDKNLTQAEIGSIMGCSINTVAKALNELPEYINTREVCMYDSNNNLLQTFSSTREAAYSLFRDLKYRSSILAACQERQEKAYGYIWHYKDTDPKDYYTTKNLKIKCLETGIIYSSISEASLQTSIDRKSINRCILGQQITAGDFHWCKADSNITIKEIELKRKKVGRKIQCVDTGEIFQSIKEATKKYSGDIKACLAGRQKTAGGKHWIYIE